MTILESPGVGEFIHRATIARPGSAVSVARLRAAYEREYGPIHRDVFLLEIGRAGHIIVKCGGSTLLVGRVLPDEEACKR
jgi:hypothetical protein